MESTVARRVLIVISLFAMQKVTNGLLSEPGCRQFAFEEQVLEKLVVLDHRVKTSLETFENKLSEFKSEQTQHREEMESFRKGLADDMQDFKSDMQGFKDDMQDFKDKMDANMTSEDEKNSNYLKKAANDMQEFKDQMNTKIESQEAEYNRFLEKADNETQFLKEALKVEARNAVQSMNETMLIEVAAIKQAEGVKHKKVGFSVYWPYSALTSDRTPTFVHTILNTGSYNSATGKFTCPVAGLYSFSLTLRVQSSATSSAYCYFRINGANKSNVVSYHDSYGSASGTMIADLDVGDVVDLGCSNWDHVRHSNNDIKFSGVLITPA